MKIACAQLSSSDNIEQNIVRADALAGEAAQQNAQLIAFPENTFQMEVSGVKRTLYTYDEHPGLKAASDIAKRHKIWLLVGSASVKIDDSGKTVNRQLLFDDNGELVSHYDKIHLFDVDVGDGQEYKESKYFLAGDKAVVAQTPWAKIGLSICYDLRFPHLYRALAKSGAEILAVPAAFTQVTGEAHWHVLLRARAIENGCFVIAPAQCGTHAGGRKTYGHAMIIDPWGNVLAEAGTDEGIIVAELDIDQVKKNRRKMPSLTHDKDIKL